MQKGDDAIQLHHLPFAIDERILLKEGEGIFVNSTNLHMAEQAGGCEDVLVYIVKFAPDSSEFPNYLD